MRGPDSSRPAVDRATDADLAFLAMDRGTVPQQFGAVLILAKSIDLTAAQRVLAGRIDAIPRLRQRLTRTPPGCGRAVWVDDRHFDLRRHLECLRCPPPGDETALLDAVVPVVLRPLPRNRPLWRAALVDGLIGGETALLLVAHHALADGLGGLAVLARLVDGSPPAPAGAFPQRPPTIAELAADAVRARVRSLRQIRRNWRRLRSAVAAGGGLAPPRAKPCSLNRPTGVRRRAVVTHADVRSLRETAHRYGGTLNAALLSVVAGALREVLARRGESLDELVVAIPVAGRRVADGARPDNQAAPLLISIPADRPLPERIARVSNAVRRHRSRAVGPPPIALLGGVFRLAAGLGGYRWYMNRQRRLHTVVSFVRGPEEPVWFDGVLVRDMLPVVVSGPSNITIAFQALSYGGSLTVAAVADPDRWPDLDAMAWTLRADLAAAASITPAH